MVIYTKKEKESGKLRMCGGAWSINLSKMPLDATVIEYITATTRYYITRDKAFERGFIKTFKGEKKLVIPIKEWDTVEKKEI